MGKLLALLLAIPSGIYLWQNSDLPQFCDFHDDCIYHVSAKSLAAGAGYRIASLPGQPPQTKHPPLYPALLSVAWWIVPAFPQNLPLAAWISWIAMPPLLLLLAMYLPRLGIEGWRAWLALGLFAVNPYVIWFGSQLLSELWFMLLLFAVMLLVERNPLAAGVLGGLAYLTRSAGIAILPAAFAYLWMRKRDRRAAWTFAAAMLPFALAWTAWARWNMTPTSDPALLYYLDYAAYEKLNISLTTMHLFLWKNVDGLLLGLGSLVLPKVTGSLFLKILAQVIAVAMINGIVKLVKAGHAHLYAMFAAVNSVLLLGWHFPPDERFVLPMFPLALAGLITELGYFVGMLRKSLAHRDRSQRVVAAGMIGAAAVIFGGALALQAYLALVLQPQSARLARAQKVEQREAYEWIRRNSPDESKAMAYSDPAFYLYTDRKVVRQSLLPKLWYLDDHAGTIDLWGNLAPFARQHGLRYYLFVDSDLGAVSDEDRTAIEKLHKTSPAMTAVFTKGSVKIYEFTGRGNTAYTTAPTSTITNPGQVVAGR